MMLCETCLYINECPNAFELDEYDCCRGSEGDKMIRFCLQCEYELDPDGYCPNCGLEHITEKEFESEGDK